jgi:predicted double-glycine peptidase
LLSPVIFATERREVSSLLEIRQDKVVMQQWDLSCGAATLTTLLKYQHGIDIDEKTVAKGLINRKEYIEDPNLIRRRQGFSLLDLKRYTEKLGLQGKSYGGLSLEDLINFSPILIPINLKGYNHFVIFRGKIGNRVLLSDPAWGNRTLTIDRFNKAWINFPKISHVGFIVSNNNTNRDFKNKLTATRNDFLILN